MDLEFVGDVVEWRGPAPFLWVQVPDEEAAGIAELAAQLTYGWGCIPVQVSLGASTWSTSLMPRAGGYLVPLKKVIRERDTDWRCRSTPTCGCGWAGTPRRRRSACPAAGCSPRWTT